MSKYVDNYFSLIKPNLGRHMPNADDHKSSSSPVSQGRRNEMTLTHFFSSKEWAEHLQQLSDIVNFELSVFDEEGQRLIVVNENRLCKFIRSAKHLNLGCPDSCDNFIRATEPEFFKCSSRLLNFVLPINRLGEKAFIVGRGDFAEYGDLLEFIKIARDHNLPEIPVSKPLNFVGKDNAATVMKYVSLTINRILRSIEDKDRLDEKLMRMTSLFDSHTFGTLSKNPQLLYRYILDTIEFVFGGISSALMLLDDKGDTYKTVCSSGRLSDNTADFKIDAENQAVKKMLISKTSVYYEDLKGVVDTGLLAGVMASNFFPIFIGINIEGIIAIFDKKFSQQDMKIMNAFTDYVKLNLENHDLRIAVEKTRLADETLTCLSDFSSSITGVLDRNELLKILLEKSLQLLNAEQGSLMLLNKDTSELIVEAHKSHGDKVKKNMRIKQGEGIAGMVVESGGSILVEDIEKDPRIRQANRGHYKTKSFISALINIEDRVTGVLNISDKVQGDVFNKDDLSLLRSIIDNSSIAIERSILFEQTEELRKLSITDPLTGIYNRRYLNRRLSEEITRYIRYKHPFSFMMLDLDKFKEYNDTFGHIAGDNLIKSLAQRMEKSLRAIDIAARFGGDEFVAIFPQTPKIDAIQITNRLKDHIDRALSQHNMEMPISVSIGLATYPDDASSIMELIEKTDQALYLAKKGGGNRVVYL